MPYMDPMGSWYCTKEPGKGCISLDISNLHGIGTSSYKQISAHFSLHCPGRGCEEGQDQGSFVTWSLYKVPVAKWQEKNWRKIEREIQKNLE